MINFDKITGPETLSDFNGMAMEIFHHQAVNCKVYAHFISLMGMNSNQIQQPEQIPFLPIDLFKTHNIVCGNQIPAHYFTSSGTTGIQTSKHYVVDQGIYEKSILHGFKRVFGDPDQYTILSLLPGYSSNPHSSLIYMVNYLQELSGHEMNGNFAHNFPGLFERLKTVESIQQPALLFGVSYALLDFSEQFPIELKNTRVIETGGMKGKRKELIRNELHHFLHAGFGKQPILSEYGMTELFSQAWMTNGVFRCPPWMKVLVRDKTDPLTLKASGSGGLNIIDLANVNTCSFIATSDAGKVYPDGSFEVLGRLDHADIRGCNLLYTDE